MGALTGATTLPAAVRGVTSVDTIVAVAAPTASARPLTDPPGSHAAKPTGSTPASIAAHRDEITAEQWQRTHAQAPVTSLEDRTATVVPVVYVLIGLTVPLGFVLLQFVAKPALARSHRRRIPTRLA